MRDPPRPPAATPAYIWQRSDAARAYARCYAETREAPFLRLCHADIHTANVLIGDDRQFWFVDWDGAALVLRERELLFVVGGISATLVGPKEGAWFFAGYGATAIDPLALAYYRYARAVGDIGAYGEQLLFRPGRSAASARAALAMLMGLFKPGEIVSLALASPT